ncbi:hypothetical protein [Saccharopolyspora spinosa]|uniref:hypothetical protein n=1 Tax=Saccharopolyspora spinosa TaxID=60894 RepID=UPI00376EA722
MTEEQAAELAELQSKVAQRKQQEKAKSARKYQARKAAAERVVVLEELAGRGPLTEEQAGELAVLQPKVAQQKQKTKERSAKEYQARKAAVERVVVLEELAGRGPLTEEQAAELAELQPKVAQRKQQEKARSAKEYHGLKAAVERVVVLEELAGRGPLTEAQAAELAELQSKVAQREQQRKERSAKEYQARKAAVDRVVVLEELKERGPLTEAQAAELAELQSKVAQRKQQRKERSAKEYQARKAAVDRVVVLEELKERGPLTEAQAAELAELQSKVAQQKQQEKAKSARKYQARKAAAERVVVLEELKERGPLTEEQAAELAALQPKVAQQKQKTKEWSAKEHQARKAAAERVVVLEELKERGPLTEAQAAELAELQSKVAQQKQQRKERRAKEYQGRKAAVERVVVLEELAGRGPLTEEQAAELAELQSKVAQQKQKTKEKNAKYHQARKAAAERVVVLEELAGRGPLSEAQAAELAELQSKVAQWKQQNRETRAKYYQGLKAAVARVAELEELAGRGPLTEKQEAELAALRPKVVGRGRKKKDRGVMDTGVGGAPVAGRDERFAGLEGVSEWTGTDQDGGDAWSADFDLGAWLELSEAGSAGSGDAGAGDAGAMLGEGAVGDVVATGLPAFLGPDAGADDFAGFLPDYLDGADPVGLFGVEGPDEGPFGDSSPEGAVWADGGGRMRWVRMRWAGWGSLGCGRFPTGMRRVRWVRWGLAIGLCGGLIRPVIFLVMRVFG